MSHIISSDSESMEIWRPTGLIRVDQLVAALARTTLWLTDAYYAGTTQYVQALRAAARDGVDVRLLVQGLPTFR